MGTHLPTTDVNAAFARLSDASRRFAATFPGESGDRQPVHTVYGGAHLFKRDLARKLGDLALKALDKHAPDAAALARALALPGDAALHERIFIRVKDKLGDEPVEDFRIDFEDGFGNRPDPEEDAEAERAACEVAAGLEAGVLPPFLGIRIKPLSDELRQRSVRTLDLFVSTLLASTGGRVPSNFVVTLPKVTMPEQVSALSDLLGALERAHGLATGTLRLELMIEMPQAILGPDGRAPIPELVRAAGGRCVACHFGTYDYTAGCSITAAHQHMMHAACDFAKHVMQVTLAGTGVWMSDGATNIMPVGDTPSVHVAWRLHYTHAQHSLVNGFYQGWDLHPAQLVTRYAAVYAFFLSGLDAAGERLRNFVEKAAQATLVGDVFDDAATGQGLLNFFLRAMSCRAVTEDEAVRLSGLSLTELRSRSFVKILEGRRTKS